MTKGTVSSKREFSREKEIAVITINDKQTSQVLSSITKVVEGKEESRYLDIRRFYKRGGDADWLPTDKGVSLTLTPDGDMYLHMALGLILTANAMVDEYLKLDKKQHKPANAELVFKSVTDLGKRLQPRTDSSQHSQRPQAGHANKPKSTPVQPVAADLDFSDSAGDLDFDSSGDGDLDFSDFDDPSPSQGRPNNDLPDLSEFPDLDDDDDLNAEFVEQNGLELADFNELPDLGDDDITLSVEVDDETEDDFLSSDDAMVVVKPIRHTGNNVVFDEDGDLNFD